MTVFQRIQKIVFALLMLLSAAIVMEAPVDTALAMILLILAASNAADAVKDMIYYFTMARHMVGGKMILFKGVVMLDFALLTISLSNIPKSYILTYLVGVHAFSGAVEILRANESRKTVEGPWKMKFAHGLVNIALAALCLIFIKDLEVAVLIYSASLVYSAVLRIIIALRKTAFIVIE
ncbi:MAG: hypothetical protein K6B74_10390 [Ruminococcus sp.]|nr:hypothetical protein [Ruminococcus sp.]